MKNKFWWVLLVVFFFIGVHVYAAPTLQTLTLQYDGQVHVYQSRPITLQIDGKIISTGAMPAIIVDGRTLVPAREVFESLGAAVGWNENTKEITILSKEQFITLQIGNKAAIVGDKTQTMEVEPKLIQNQTEKMTKTMIPFRFVAEILGYEVRWDPQNYVIDAIPPQPVIPEEPKTPVEQKPNQELPTETPRDSEPSNTKQPVDPKEPLKDTIEWNKEEKGVTLPLSEPIERQEHPVVNIHTIQRVTTEQQEDSIFIGADGPISYFESHTWENKLIIDISNGNMKLKNLDQVSQNHPLIQKLAASQYQENPKITRIVFDLKNAQTKYHIGFSKDRKSITVQFFPNEIYHVAMQSIGEEDVLYIKGTWGPELEVSRLSNPDRLVIDLPYTMNPFGGKEEGIKGKYVQSIRTSQFTPNTARLVLDLQGQPDYSIQKQGESGIILCLTSPTYQHMEYSNGKSVQLKLKKDPKNPMPLSQVVHEDHYNAQKYILTLPKDYTSFYGTGIMKINDGILDRIEIKNNDKQQTQFIFNQKRITAYQVTEDEAYIYITLLRPKEVYKQIVVIDAGHGGSDPGAGANGLNEKSLNLDISKRLWKHLEQDPAIKVYMTRMEDTYPTLQQRCDLANELDTDLFISVHNNAAANTKVKGTEVLYFPDGIQYENGLTGKGLAQILYQHLVDQLGTHRRGVIPRDDLYVLKYTKMPAVILEIGFITNAEDAAQLKTESFREQAAQAVYQGILDVFQKYPTGR